MPRITKRTIPDTIGGRIQKLRIANGLDQKDLAHDMGVSRETVNQWESETRDLKTKHTIKLAERFGVTCDYILRGFEAENVDIYEKTGLKDHAVRNLTIFKNDKSDWTGFEIEVLNLLLQRADFYELIAGINWARIDRINKLIYEADENRQSTGIYGCRVYGGNIILDPIDFYQYNINELKDDFFELVESIIDDSIQGKTIEDLKKDKESLISKWEEVIKHESDLDTDEQREELVDYLRVKYGKGL